MKVWVKTYWTPDDGTDVAGIFKDLETAKGWQEDKWIHREFLGYSWYEQGHWRIREMTVQ